MQDSKMMQGPMPMQGQDKQTMGSAGPMHRYGQDFESYKAMAKPTDPNEFMKWLFSSGILTEHQKDLIRARFADPMMQAAPAGPTAPAGAGNVTGQPPPQQ